MAEKAAARTKKQGVFAKIGQFFKDVRAEIKKNIWPTPKQVLKNTLIVIAVILAVGAVIWIVDALLALLLGLVF